MPKNKKILYGIFIGSFLTLALIALIIFSNKNHQSSPSPEEKPEEGSQVAPQCFPEATNFPPPLFKEAQADLASRLGIAEERIELFCAERVDWPDTSLGLPQPGKIYAQVITPGFRLLFKINEKTYQYHTDYQRVLFAGQQ